MTTQHINPQDIKQSLKLLPKDPAERIWLLRDPLVFLQHCVYTFDNADQKTPIKKFPIYPYTELIVRLFQTSDKFLIDKSRRMTISWIAMALHGHYAMSQTERLVGIFSKKQEDADELVGRVKFIDEHIPEEIWPKELRPKANKKQNKLTYEETNSVLMAFPQGPDQARQHGFSRIFFDEYAFWPEGEETYGATLPTLQGGGKMMLVSTHPKLFGGSDPHYRKLIEDRLDDKPKPQVSPSIPEFENWIPKDRKGVKCWKNSKNGLTVLQLHYSADPTKRKPEWKTRMSQGYSIKDWNTEYELSWETYGGKPVYEGAFNKNFHVLECPKKPVPDIPILRGWDFGGSQSCVITQVIDSKIFVIDELPNLGRNTRKFAPEVIEFCNTSYGPNFWYVDIIDPSAMWEGQTATGFACVDVMREFDLDPEPALSQNPDVRIEAVKRLLMTNDDKGPFMMISPQCTMLISGFEGGYQYPEKMAINRRMDRPLKNQWSHIHDALQYVCTHVTNSRANEDTNMDYESYESDLDYTFLD